MAMICRNGACECDGCGACEDPQPVCPGCQCDCDTIYKTNDGKLLGCENCIDVCDAYDLPEVMASCA